MLHGIDMAATYGILAAGVTHTALTPIFKPSLGEDGLWFAGAGLALTFLASLNLARHRTPEAFAHRLCRTANVVGAGYMVVVARVVPEPHVYGVLASVITVTFASFAPPASVGQDDVRVRSHG